MKTIVLQVEPHDDYTSVKDKMTWGKTERVLLVWSRSSQTLSRKVDLVLIQRYAISMGVQLALVANNVEVRYHANTLGIPLFDSVQQAQKKNWRSSKRNPSRKNQTFSETQSVIREKNPNPTRNEPYQSPPWIDLAEIQLLFFSLGVIAVLSLAAVLAPSATIILIPETKEQKLKIPIKADPALERSKISGEIPARLMKVIVEGQKSLPVSGIAELPDKSAHGEITITNLSENPVRIPNGLIVLNKVSEPVRFQTTNSAEITAGVGQAITLPIQALSPGVSGNLPENSITAVEGPLGINITVTNPQPTIGGTNHPSPIPTNSDRQKLFNILQVELEQTARQEILAQLEENDRVLTTQPINEQTVEKTYIPADNSPTDQITLKAQIEFQFLKLSGEDLVTLAQNVAASTIPRGYTVIPNTMKITDISISSAGDPNLFSGWLSFQQYLIVEIEPQQVINLTQALPIQKAIQLMNLKLPLSRPAMIKLSPHWWPRMPLLPIRIHITTQFAN